jgi:[acyl-carrier-protein] S-malonyltransferase
MSYGMVFPGQGAQSVGMMEGYAESAVVRQTFAEAQALLGVDFWALQAEGTAEGLARTTITQPLLLTAGVAVYRQWRASGAPAPTLLAGHSLGEYGAMVVAEAMSFITALKVVQKRAELMESAAEHGVGAMAAILNASLEQINLACQLACINDESVEPVNYNTPEQVVIAGHRGAVERACAWLKENGVKRAILLPVGGAFHSRLMQSASESMREVLAQAEIRPPIIPIIHNATLQPHNSPDDIREALAKQVSAPVRWVETIEKMAAQSIQMLVECALARCWRD